MLACIVLVVAFTGLSARLVYVQIVKHDEYAQRAMRQRSYKQILPARRGQIFAANGEPLVKNRPTQDIIADRNVIRDINLCVRAMAHAHGLKPKAYRSLYDDEEIRQRYAARLAQVIEEAIGAEPAQKVQAMATKDSRRVVVPLGRKIDHNVATQLADVLEKEKLSGIQFEDSIKRHYFNPSRAGHLIGWVDYESRGAAGIELALDPRLRGRDGSRLVEKDGRRDEIAIHRGETIEPVDGEDVHLTIDLRLQEIVEAALAKVAKLHTPEKVTAIFMDRFTGEILAMANYPEFNVETREGKNYRNFAISDRYEPGSTFKVISLAASYDSGVVTPGEEINCENGSYTDHGLGFTFKDHHPYGNLSSGMVLAKSSNIGTYKMVKELGKNTLYTYIRDFGFGTPTGIALPGEVAGLVHKPNSRFWSKTSLSRIGIGYEVDVTPLQMVNALCAVANGGVLMQPQIVSKITDSCGEPSYELTPHKVRRVISEETADHVREAMLLVTGEHGTGKLAAVDGFPTAGKTGTAFKPKKDRSKGYIPGHYIASFMGFLPAENPRLAGIVIVDDPVGKDAEGKDLSRYGGSVAGRSSVRSRMQRCNTWASPHRWCHAGWCGSKCRWPPCAMPRAATGEELI